MSWQTILRQSYQSAAQIAPLLKWDAATTAEMSTLVERYPMLVNPYYFSLIDLDDPDDPIRKMSIPMAMEQEEAGSADTSGETQNTIIPGLQHKYGDTALVLSTDRCAMYCRHCFRKRMVGIDGDEVAGDIDAIANYVKDHPEITNVLISGGDAFLNSNQRIKNYLAKLAAIEHLDFIRFGTRTPVVIPQRISEDPELLHILSHYSKQKQLVVVTQFNHPKELTEEARAAIRLLWQAGVVVLNQTVLLQGINDDPAVLGKLMRELTRAGVVPYYVFQCRPAKGVKNIFQVPLLEGVEIVKAARQQQSGIGRNFRYMMSHPTGKIEILGSENDELLLKYHHAKHPQDHNRIFRVAADETLCWLPDPIVER